jgi:hypothetical protein
MNDNSNVVELTRIIRDQYFNLQLANQELNLKYTAAVKENEQLEQKIQKLITAGNVLYTLLDPPSISMRTTEYDNALQGWDDAKIS